MSSIKQVNQDTEKILFEFCWKHSGGRQTSHKEITEVIKVYVHKVVRCGICHVYISTGDQPAANPNKRPWTH